MIAMIGTSDRLCWLAETCKILLLLLCIVLVKLPLEVLFLALMNSGLGHTAFVGVTVICLLLVGACNAFCSLGLIAIACLLLLVVWLVLLMLLGLTGSAWLAIVVLWGMRCTWFPSVLPLLLYGLGMQACSQVAQTP